MTMRSLRPALLLVAGLGLASCADLTPTQQSTGIGALGGAALGGVVGSFSGNAGLGALLGAGVGGAGGYLYGQSQQQRQQPYRGRRGDGYSNYRGY
jgi:outer membrane lipoprotein SlyB